MYCSAVICSFSIILYTNIYFLVSNFSFSIIIVVNLVKCLQFTQREHKELYKKINKAWIENELAHIPIHMLICTNEQLKLNSSKNNKYPNYYPPPPWIQNSNPQLHVSLETHS